MRAHQPYLFPSLVVHSVVGVLAFGLLLALALGATIPLHTTGIVLVPLLALRALAEKGYRHYIRQEVPPGARTHQSSEG